jgi:EAL domain-containing protein (putative c-di-GMP-specific phosphodiesterase class I)
MELTAENPLVPLLATEPDGGDSVDTVLRSVRTHLGMDVAFVAEFGEHDRLFRHVDAEGPTPVKAGDRVPLEVGYCQRVVDGRLPELIVDAQVLPEARDLPETRAIPIGSHLSVPIRLHDGSLYGTFCCFSFLADPSLTRRDLQMMRAFADILADQIDRRRQSIIERTSKARAIQSAIQAGDPAIVYQPIYDMSSGSLVAVESLSRFRSLPARTPDIWFSEAAKLGLGPTLEAVAVKSALLALGRIPVGTDIAINVSPEAIFEGTLSPYLQGVDLQRVILELTEHSAVTDYERLLALLAPWRALGLRIAVDDAGAGYASLRHILAIEPDIIKLDISLTRGIDADRKRRALASALIAFARESNIAIIAEGVETDAEFRTLAALGVTMAQGYYLARPAQLEEIAGSVKFPVTSSPIAQLQGQVRSAS